MLSSSSQPVSAGYDASVKGEAANVTCSTINNMLLLFIVPSSTATSTTGMFYYNNIMQIPNVLLYCSTTFLCSLLIIGISAIVI